MIILAVFSGLTLLLSFLRLIIVKAWLSWAVVVVLAGTITVSVFFADSPFAWLGISAGAWAVIGSVRLVSGRYSESAAIRTFLPQLVTYLSVVWLALWLGQDVDSTTVIKTLLFCSLGISILAVILVVKHMISYKITVSEPLVGKEQPTVTLAIPARNETHALEATSRAALASDYEKLEVIMIDDCSQDNTSKIIRGFAHDGVRFIEGSVPTEQWLGKNNSYRRLLDEASGDFILFSGVDVQISPQAIRLLVEFAVDHKLEMVSVMPQRLDIDITANFLQTMRYFMQLVIPWRWFGSQPVLSSLWLVNRRSLEKAGGFDELKSLVVPERRLASMFARDKKYHFAVSDSQLGLTTRKRVNSQLNTATRNLYPSLNKNPLFVFLVGLSLASLAILPYVLAMTVLFGSDYAYGWVAVAASLLLTIVNLAVYTRFSPANWFVGLVNFPLMVILNIVMYQWSMIKYELSTVIWKDRNICLPVLQEK